MADKNLMQADIAALMTILGMIIKALEIQGIVDKQVFVDVLETVMSELSEEETAQSMRPTLETFHQILAGTVALDSLLH